MSFEKTFETANEQHIKTVTGYPDSNGVLFTESAHKTGNEISKADVINLFKKGFLAIATESGLVYPTVLEFSDATDYATVKYVASGTTALEFVSCYSGEYTPSEEVEEDITD